VVRLATRAWNDRAAPRPGGRRPLAVLVHGVISSSRTWWRVAPALVERGFEVLTVDLRGHGASPRMTEGLGLSDLATDLVETFQASVSAFAPAAGAGEAPAALLPPRIDLLLGHSLGALVASQLLATRPGLARRLVLEDPPGLSTTDWIALADGIEADGARARADPEGLRRDLLADSSGSPPEEAERRLADLAECDAAGIAAALRRRVTYDLPGLMGSVHVPTLLLVGQESLGSALVEPDRSALVGALGRGTVEVLPAGHNLHREALDAFMAAIERWLGDDARLD
jgi:pimeloyl-ACP methyl ester carboxylesterase